ncbi:DUF5677 domain-containing protein [Verminephrobacter aporrectodeae]|uniref:DUF5677 domain-containing protein n=1 Tax=Verminephrobacter aporrectodeae TaxID=1110389 RepID=UPI002243BCF7|nr:DUF5677 domain-containing protein [Verminephrobacter aporrectodeae]MCW8176800.1 hypothetical protein [Verminephrobacter aporrectodeae subsp. tuberculatae]MCW8204340.1 hypothetical protein [Verminephrobacter aporrectodeae subsp. tuberculatae]
MTLNQTNASDWITFASEVHKALWEAADDAMEHANEATNSWSAKNVAIRLLLRSCDNFKGVIVLIKSDLVAESRAITRCLIENAFGARELLSDESKYIDMLLDDHACSQLRRSETILSSSSMCERLSEPERLKQFKNSIDKRRKFIDQKSLADKGASKSLYLIYQWLSDDALHTTAQSLRRYVGLYDKTQPGCRWSVVTHAEHIDTLYYAIFAALTVGLSVSQLLGTKDANSVLAHLDQRLNTMKPAERTYYNFMEMIPMQ